MTPEPLSLARRSLLIITCLGIGVSAGCGPGFKVVPVAGKVTINGKPIADADVTVMFRPDGSKGNTIELDFAGTADDDGNYKLNYGNGNPGAGIGWYKVAVIATESLSPRRPPTLEERKKLRPGPNALNRKSLIDKKYSLATSSGIEIEVVENPAPGAYDLDLKGPGTK